jgi:phospholipid/cholesterol/gamma-HCH transport system substrate-binding protein
MKLTNETKIGILVVVVFTMLAFFTVRAGNFNVSAGKYVMKVRFVDIDGVDMNSPVMFNGLDVGIVKEINIIDVDDETKIELLLWIDNGVKIREGTKAYVKNLGFMGEKYIGLVSGDVQGAVMEPGSIIMGEQPPSFQDLVIKGNDIAADVAGIAKNLNERLEINKENIDTILAEMSELTSSLSSLSRTLDERITNNEQHIDEIIANLNATSVNIKELTHDLKLNPWKLLHKSEK